MRRVGWSEPVLLIGLPGAGKTAVAPLLAARLGRRWDDLDRIVERAAGRTVPEIFRREGEAGFRRREAAALREVLGAGREGLVIACGGGIVVGEESRALLGAGAAAVVVWLRVTPDVASERLGAEGASERPLLSDAARGAGANPGPGGPPAPGGNGAALDRLRALHAEREPLYEAVSAIAVPTDGRTPDDVAAAAEAALRERWAGSAS